ncbi:charged multivesicular body protein 6-A isoform X1 [Cryptotermes secundus]|uniref:charged multivesicular body protein 6-A isoform X1 n=1 Tax=Cryptotermes secundus TaxID=105785 RepID=UPI000CD7B763|nr:charged multivesicular body protein 6-A isoform X1 [Cryptotermes secundus]
MNVQLNINFVTCSFTEVLFVENEAQVAARWHATTEPTNDVTVTLLQGLKRQRDGMIEYQRRTRKCLRKDREVTIKLLKDGKEDHAKILMKKVKCQERDLQASYGQLRNLQELVYTMEMALILCR